MSEDEKERFAGNEAINEDIHEILAEFPEPSRSKMRRRIRLASETLRQQRNDQSDEQARHIFREFLVAAQLNRGRFNLQYEVKIGRQTPDWYDSAEKLLLEVFTCERGSTSDPKERFAARVVEKVNRYKSIIAENDLRFIVGVHGDFLSGFDDEIDCSDAINEYQLFRNYSLLSGVIFFTESTFAKISSLDGSKRLKQQYRFAYFANNNALRPINLTAAGGVVGR